ncbi:uveal autoantigen with coiled-coil domains and ankyrin repeats protein [Sardina pilchardus]|uniref:uveal autoantigen with coiled-coil domains and ankyrin repeats protein n=1 Tax=Sardina pilchardus TaxID=27697 RepID=UPI002E107105
MKSLKYRLKKHEVTITNTDWNKYDDRLMKAVERGEVDKVAAVLSKKGIIPTKLDVEGRSAFHLAATRGHVDCLNLILGHSVDVTATDATGKNALHLAARNGQSLCVQRLLQYNCPVGNVDLQGRSALHDAVMAGCASSVKLLCDSGASVNTSDFDGRTPLVLATQMCHPRICQLLLERGADITVRDKQNKTALILGCEYACRDAVEVLLRSGADVTATDGAGHDSYHYARISKNQELVALVRSYLDSTNKAKEAARMELKKRQQSVEVSLDPASNTNKDQMIHDLERQNESQQESLRKFHQEQRALMDQVNMLQQQLSQEKSTVEDIHMEREQLRHLLTARGEDGARAVETVKVQMKSHLGDYSGQSVIKGKENILVRQSHSLDSAQVLQSAAPTRSVSRPLELTRTPSLASSSGGEAEGLRRELDALRRRQEAAEEEAARLQAALSHKARECEELAASRDAAKREADLQVRQLEEALGDVQQRMLDSEAKVKQLQAHVVAVKEHLSNQLVEDLRTQLGDVKGKYEGASAEVGRVRNHLKLSEKALEEYKKSEGQLAVEAERLTQELNLLKEEREDMAETLVDMEAHVKEVEVRLSAMVPSEKFDNMKNLLTNAVDEKEKQIAELREDYDRVLEEVAELHREMDHRSGPAALTVPLQEHERVRAALEEQSASLRRKLADLTAKSQALIQEVEESEEEREVLREQLDDLRDQIQSEFVPLQSHEDVQRSLGRELDELREQLDEASERKRLAEEELRRVRDEKASLCENVTLLQSTHVSGERFRSEVDALTARHAELERELDAARRGSEERERELREALAEKEALEQSLRGREASREDYEGARAELTAALDESKNQISALEKSGEAREEELRKVEEGSAMLKEELEKVQKVLEKDYISLGDHQAVTSTLSSALAEAEERAKEALSRHQSAQDDTAKLHEEIEAQKRELDTIQEAIHVKFVPLAAVQEKESGYEAALRDLSEQLSGTQDKYEREKAESERRKRETERLEAELQEALRKLAADLESGEGRRDEEEEKRKGQSEEELSLKLVDLEQQYKEVTVQRAELEEQNALCATEIQALQRRLEGEYVRLERFEAAQQALTDSLQQAQEQCQQAQAAQRHEAERARQLEQELNARGGGDTAAVDEEQEEARRALEQEVARLRQALREEADGSAQRAEDVAALQSELLRATQALEELRGREEGEVAPLRRDKQRLEEEAQELGTRLAALHEQYEELYRETAARRDAEGQARAEADALQAKSAAIEGEIGELKERYDGSLHTIGELQKRIQMSSEQTEAKDKRITELLADVERLKQALNGLSQLAYSGSAPNKRQAQHIDALQAQVKSLQQQLADAERQHREVVSIYRTHLLSAAQGHMDEDVQAALLQIIRMRQEFVC